MARDNYILVSPCKNCKKGCKVKLHPSLASTVLYCKKQEVK